MKAIDKDAVLAEIEKKEKYAQTLGDNAINSSMQQFYDGMKECCQQLSVFLNTLEVKEVDDRPECKIFPRPIECYSNCKECTWLATNNKSQKGKEV